MKKLLKAYGLDYSYQYYELIAESFLNGQTTQGYQQFLAMPKLNRVDMLKQMTTGEWACPLGNHKIKELFDCILK